MQCFRVAIPPAVRPTLLRQMGMGSSTCAQIGVRAVHAKADHLRHKDEQRCESFHVFSLTVQGKVTRQVSVNRNSCREKGGKIKYSELN